jgi:hypothetical protein
MQMFQHKVFVIQAVYENGYTECRTLTPMQVAAWKRSKDYKRLVSKKVLFTITTQIKTH